MSRKCRLWFLAAVITIGSFICFYATNLILSDVANMYMMSVTFDVVASLPLFTIALEFILAAIAIIRNQRRPEYRKAQLTTYSTILIVLSCVGMVATIESGTHIYGLFLVPYPFEWSLAICGAWHLLAVIAGFFMKARIWYLPDDPKVRKKTMQYRVHTFMLILGMFFAFDRFGALLWAPFYVHIRSLGITWPFYLSLLLPLAVVGDNVIYAFGFDKDKPKLGARYISGVIIADIVLGAVVIFRGMNNSLFISAISPALGLERLATLPIDTILQFGLVLLMGIYSLVYALKGKTRK